jgi:hypothetical protein
MSLHKKAMFKKVLSAFFSILLLSTSVCHSKEEGTASEYQKDGLSFTQPARWKVTEDETAESSRYITIESPGNNIVTIEVFELDGEFDLDAYVIDYSEVFSELIRLGNVRNLKHGEMETTGGFKRVISTFDVKLLFVTVPHTRIILSKEMAGKNLNIIGNGPSDELTQLQSALDTLSRSIKINP